jgi:uncharacterized membrane protein YeaQ/YmgE (transglycosylase-associated protein family)
VRQRTNECGLVKTRRHGRTQIRIERTLTNRSPEWICVECPLRTYAPWMSMSTALFIVIGIAACGFTRGRFNNTLGGLLLDLCLGIVGAVAAGSLFNYYIGVGIAQSYIASGLVAISGAALLLASYHVALWIAGYRQLDGSRPGHGSAAGHVPGRGRNKPVQPAPSNYWQ